METLVAALGLAVTIIIMAITATFVLSNKLSDIQKEFKSEIAEHQRNDDREFAAVRNEMRGYMDELRKQIGETFTAIREKINLDSLYARDNFTRRDSFFAVTERMTEEMKAMRQEILATFATTVARIEKKSGDPHP